MNKESILKVTRGFDKEGTEEAIDAKKAFLLFAYTEAEKEIKEAIGVAYDEYALGEDQMDKIMEILERLEFLARELYR